MDYKEHFLRLITRRSLVQIQAPLPNKKKPANRLAFSFYGGAKYWLIIRRQADFYLRIKNE